MASILDKVSIGMDVSNTEHCQIVGKNGQNLKFLTSLTSTKIFLPDNRNKIISLKSNIITINGHINCAAEAMELIRKTSRLHIHIPLPERVDPKIISVVITAVKEIYSTWVSIFFEESTRSILLTALKKYFTKFYEVVNNVQNMLSRFNIDVNGVFATTEVDPRNRKCLLENLQKRRIPEMDSTNMTYLNANYGQNGSSTFGGSTVKIDGQLLDVLKVKKHIEGCLPIKVVFNIDSSLYQEEWLTHIGKEYGVTIQCPSPDETFEFQPKITVIAPEMDFSKVVSVRYKIFDTSPEDVVAFLRQRWSQYPVARSILNQASGIIFRQRVQERILMYSYDDNE